ncbi:uncharacterized protein [Palaemon carinicauda]|uniref:uncharacterized protein n=1 Tax=Palaemon carinicauda TaxID=392227 RepID=UPI0035B59C78
MKEAFSTRCLLAILLQLFYILMRGCHVDGRNSVPCPVVNKLTGAVVCCPSVEDTTLKHAKVDQGCKTLYPKESLPLMAGSWSIESYNEAKSSWHKVSVKTVNSTCCCREKRDFILPGLVASAGESLGASKVVQHSAGYIQPILIRTCSEQSCSIQSNKDTIFNCIQNWTERDLYTEDLLHNGFMHLEKVLVPDGCRCRNKDESKETLENDDSFLREKSKFEARSSTSTSISNNNGSPGPGEPRTDQQTPMDYSKSDGYKVKRQATPTNTSKLGLDYYDPLGTPIPSSTLVKYNVSSYKDDLGPSDLQNLFAYLSQNLPLVSLGGLNGGNFNDSLMSRDELVKVLRGLMDNSLTNDKPFIDSTFQNTSSSCSNTKNCSNLDYTSTYPILDLSSTGPQRPIALPAEQPNGLSDTVKSSQLVDLNVNQASFLNMLEVMKYNLEMNLLGGTFGRMTTAEIMKNILTYVPESEQAHIQSTAEKMMETEMNYLQTSLKMMEILSKFTGSLDPAKSALNFLFNINDTGKNPLISRPGINNPDRFEFVNDPISNISLPQGNKENVENIERDPTPGTNQTKVDEAAVESFPAPSIAPKGPSESRLNMIDRMEEELHSAFANFIFQEAWTNLNCTVPNQITESVSEVNFLPSLIKKEFNLMAKGLLDINKFTGRLISGIIMCHIPDLEEALKDGRLITAISGGVMAAEFLNKQVKIVKGVMQGILDTSDAKKIADILRWSVQSKTGPSRREFLNLQEESRIDSLQKTLNNSLGEYVEFLKGKTSSDRVLSNFPSNFSSSSVPNAVTQGAFTEELNKNENRLPGISPVFVGVTPPSGTTKTVSNSTLPSSKKPLLLEIKFTTPTPVPEPSNSVSPISNLTILGVNVTTAATPNQGTVLASSTAGTTIPSEVITTDTLVSRNRTLPPNAETNLTLSLQNLTGSSNTLEPNNNPSTNGTQVSSGTLNEIPVLQNSSAATEASSRNKTNIKVDTSDTENTDAKLDVEEYEYTNKKDYLYKDYEYNDYGYKEKYLGGGYLENKTKYDEETYPGTNKLLKNIANINEVERADVNSVTDSGEALEESREISGVQPLLVDYSYDGYETEKGLFRGKDEEDGSNDLDDNSVDSNVDKYEEYNAEKDNTGNDYSYVDYSIKELSRNEKEGEFTPNSEDQYTNDENRQNSKDKSKIDEYAPGSKESGTIYSYDELKSNENSTSSIASVHSEDNKNVERDLNGISDIKDKLENNLAYYEKDNSEAANSEEKDKHTGIGVDHVHFDNRELGDKDVEEGERDETSHKEGNSGEEDPVADNPASAVGDASTTIGNPFIFEDDIDLLEEYHPIDMSPINLQMLFTNLNV